MGRKKKEKTKAKGRLPSGSIRKQVYLGKDASGKRRYKSFTAATGDDLDLMIAAWKVARAAGELEPENVPSKEVLTVSEAVRRYIDLKEPVLSPTTVRGYKTDARNYISSDPIGLTDIEELTTKDVQLWISHLAEDVSPKTIRNAYGLLKSSVQMFRPDWFVRVTLPQKRPADLYCPSDADIKALLAVVDDRELEIAILLAAFGPMRRSEIMALESTDVQGSTISITKALVQNDDKEWVIKEPKTVTSRRKIDMPEFVIERMKGIKGRIIKCTPNALSDKYQRAIKEANCPNFRFHDLRHYGASIMHAMGIPDKYVMARGGWSSNGVMQRVYQNVIDKEQVKQTRKINSHFSRMKIG